jgi:hypothetical protein
MAVRSRGSRAEMYRWSIQADRGVNCWRVSGRWWLIVRAGGWWPVWLSVLAVRMWCVSKGRALRRIADPVAAGGPAGVRIRTRIHPTAAEAQTLAAVGELLGSVYRGELAGRVGLGRLDRKAHASWRAQRKQALTAVSSSRWAGAITRAVEDQYQLGMRGLVAQVADLRAAVGVLEARCVLRPGELAPAAAGRAAGLGGIASPRSGSLRLDVWRCW